MKTVNYWVLPVWKNASRITGFITTHIVHIQLWTNNTWNTIPSRKIIAPSFFFFWKFLKTSILSYQQKQFRPSDMYQTTHCNIKLDKHLLVLLHQYIHTQAHSGLTHTHTHTFLTTIHPCKPRASVAKYSGVITDVFFSFYHRICDWIQHRVTLLYILISIVWFQTNCTMHIKRKQIQSQKSWNADS